VKARLAASDLVVSSPAGFPAIAERAPAASALVLAMPQVGEERLVLVPPRQRVELLQAVELGGDLVAVPLDRVRSIIRS
jgi:hypothetical protein